MTESNERVAGLAGLAVLLLVLLATHLASIPPAPKPSGAPASEFSAGRASEILRQLVGDSTPHPIGTEANMLVRDRIVSSLRALGYRPRVTRAWACSRGRVCAWVENIVAIREGRVAGPAVLLATHYDSVGAGPGASDDGVAVAASLEIARILAGEQPRQHPVILLISDGEEAGLLGAEAFVAQDPLARRIGAVVNLEARGSSGPSFMFETSRNNRWLIEALRRSVRRPSTSSLYVSVYERLPNDTDFSVFKRAGMQGLNFAFIRTVQHYHTPLDNFANASPRSLQHHGDNALAMVRALAEGPLPRQSSESLTYFDVFSRWIVSWPQHWNPWIALIGSVLVLFAAWRLLRSDGERPGPVIFGFARFWLSVALTALVMIGEAWLLRKSGAFPTAWSAHPGAALTFAWMAAMFISLASQLSFQSRSSLRSAWAGTAISWSLLSWIAVVMLPGGTYLFLMPLIAYGVAGLVWSFRPGSVTQVVAAVLPAAITGMIMFPLALSFYDAMGLRMLPVIGVLISMVATTVTPWFAPVSGLRRTLFAALGSAALASLIVAVTREPYSAQRPEKLNLSLRYDVDGGEPDLLATPESGRLPESLRRAARWKAQPQVVFPWFFHARYFRGTPSGEFNAADSPPPELTTISEKRTSDGRILLLRIASGRAGHRVTLNFHSRSIRRLVVGGAVLPEIDPQRRRLAEGWTRVELRGIGQGPVDIEIDLRGHGRLEGVMEDWTYGLPATPFAQALLRARGEKAVPADNGDQTVVTKKFAL